MAEVIEVEFIKAFGCRCMGKIRDYTEHKSTGGSKTFRINKRGILPALARDLLKEGVAGDSLLRPTRDGKPVLDDRTVDWWAGRSISEGSSGSVRLVKYVPFNGLAGSKKETE